MSQSISKVCDQLVDFSDQFGDTEGFVEAIVGSENAEDLVIAIGMAIAFSEGAITLNKVENLHLRSSLKELTEIAKEFEDGDE